MKASAAWALPKTSPTPSAKIRTVRSLDETPSARSWHSGLPAWTVMDVAVVTRMAGGLPMLTGKAYPVTGLILTRNQPSPQESQTMARRTYSTPWIVILPGFSLRALNRFLSSLAS
jgi:hypothetical protein